MWSATYMTNNNPPTSNPPNSSHPNHKYPNNKYPDDDGRVIADMSQVVKVGMLDLIAPEGLRQRLGGRRPGGSAISGGSHPGDSMNHSAQNAYGNSEPIELTEGELKALIKASLKAAFLLAGVFIGAAGLFILFCIFVWFR